MQGARSSRPVGLNVESSSKGLLSHRASNSQGSKSPQQKKGHGPAKQSAARAYGQQRRGTKIESLPVPTKAVIRTNSRRKKKSESPLQQPTALYHTTRLQAKGDSRQNLISPYKKLLFGDHDMYYKRSYLSSKSNKTISSVSHVKSTLNSQMDIK